MNLEDLPVLANDPQREGIWQVVDRAELIIEIRTEKVTGYVLGNYSGNVCLANRCYRESDSFVSLGNSSVIKIPEERISDYFSLGLSD